MSDLISRQAAIDAIRKSASEFSGFMEMEMYTVDDAIKAVNTVPSKEPVLHGMFIGTEYDGFADGNPVYYEWKCSECGCIFEEDEPTYRYCPNCGAKMDKLQESEE